ncbi:hypothetical protein [Salinimicrobium soli]|uniref:hypothetical protein n=1 Tax=Salinimicrobium soli TaxID=1254399 RepID=UPI003AB01B08
METLPLFLPILFGLTVLGSLILFYLAIRSKTFLILAIGWITLQSVLGLSGIYQNTELVPPRLMLFGVLPTLIFITLTFVTEKGRAFIDRVNLKTLTHFHSIRIPVEIVLLLLYYNQVMSVYITFEGTNFDIISGITAPIVGYLAFRKSTKRQLLIWWNMLCLLLLFNVVVTAVLALPSPFQQLAFDQPNIAVMYFPFNLLPAFVVPLVLFAHLISFRQLTGKSELAEFQRR